MASFPSDFVPNLPNDTFAIINTQPSNTTGEHRIMIANFHHELYFADSLGDFSRKYHSAEHCRTVPKIPYSIS